MTYTEFMKKVDKSISAVSHMGAQDFADVLWRDLYDDNNNGEDATDEDIRELLADGDDIFAAMYEIFKEEPTQQVTI